MRDRCRRRDRGPDHLAPVVDRGRVSHAAEGREELQRAVPPHECLAAVQCVARYLASLVDPRYSRRAAGHNICDHAVAPQERMMDDEVGVYEGITGPRYLTRIVDVGDGRRIVHASTGAWVQVGHHPVRPQKRVAPSEAGAPAHHLPTLVDVGRKRLAAKSAQVLHHTVLPHERVRTAPCVLTEANDLPPVVDSRGEGDRHSAELAKVDDLVRDDWTTD